MAGLPRSIIKKYGVSKKAWAVFRGGHVTTKRTGATMARRRKGGFRRGRARGGNILMKGFFGSKVPFGLLGLVGAGYLYSKFVSPSVPKVIPMQSALTESAVIGGLPAAIGSFLAGSNLGVSSSGSANW